MINLFVISEKSIQKKKKKPTTKNLFHDSKLMTLNMHKIIIQDCCVEEPTTSNTV